MFSPKLNNNIVWDRCMKIADIDLTNFCFEKDDLIVLARNLWPCLSPFLSGGYDALEIKYNYHCPFETAFLMLLH